MKKIISIVGARPQFIKHAPMQLALQKEFNALTIHTGQHYDKNMSDVFFNELNIPQPDFLFDIGGSQHQAAQTGIMMTEIEKTCLDEKPDAMLVYGDTNSTLAGTLVAAKMNIPLIHIEAGLRSYNRTMPEEINRIIADEFSFMLFCPSEQSIQNLHKEGIYHENIFACGDVMCDTLNLIRNKLTRKKDFHYYFVTLHRPYNTDDAGRLNYIFNVLNKLDKRVVFPIHPRTKARVNANGDSLSDYPNIDFIEPVGYIDSVSLQMFSEGIITDSGGIQKEAYMLKKKCITLRSETEWVETLIGGWNTLIFDNIDDIPGVFGQPVSNYNPLLYGNGNAADEIVKIIKSKLL